MNNLISLSQELMITLRFDYKINNFADKNFNYNDVVNNTSLVKNIYNE